MGGVVSTVTPLGAFTRATVASRGPEQDRTGGRLTRSARGGAAALAALLVGGGLAVGREARRGPIPSLPAPLEAGRVVALALAAVVATVVPRAAAETHWAMGNGGFPAETATLRQLRCGTAV